MRNWDNKLKRFDLSRLPQDISLQSPGDFILPSSLMGMKPDGGPGSLIDPRDWKKLLSLGGKKANKWTDFERRLHFKLPPFTLNDSEYTWDFENMMMDRFWLNGTEDPSFGFDKEGCYVTFAEQEMTEDAFNLCLDVWGNPFEDEKVRRDIFNIHKERRPDPVPPGWEYKNEKNQTAEAQDEPYLTHPHNIDDPYFKKQVRVV
tara:strand:+ start:58 stop:666 length:609 start_codon:yes stop_codon:yes gene_type:complete